MSNLLSVFLLQKYYQNYKIFVHQSLHRSFLHGSFGKVIFISDESGTTSGLDVSECGQIGVTISDLTVGSTIGPPADSE